MKIKFSLLFIVISLCSCETKSIEQLNRIKKPAVVFSQYKARAWYERSTMVLKGADGKLISLNDDGDLKGLIDKYNIGDTIK